MKIAVMGTGGIGGYFGGRIAEKGNADVTFIARGAHMKAMQDKGLALKSELGDVLISPVKVTDTPAEIGPVDVVMFAVKLYDVETALEAIRPLIGPDTAVISFQNGIGTENRIAEMLGAKHAVGGIAYIPIAIESPGVIRHEGKMASIAFGELDGTLSDRLTRFNEICQEAGVKTRYTDNIREALWDKFVFLASFAGITATTRQTVGYVQQNPLAMDLFGAALREAITVAAAEGVSLSAETFDRTMKVVSGMASTAQSSMLTDLQAGKPLEVKWFSGELVRLSQKHDIATPVHQAFAVAMTPFEDGNK